MINYLHLLTRYSSQSTSKINYKKKYLEKTLLNNKLEV